MDFKEALESSMKQDNRTHADPFLLYSRVSDLVGNDYEAKKAAEQFYRLDARYEITKTILQVALPKQQKKKKHVYHIKPMPIPFEKVQIFFDTKTGVVHRLNTCPCIHDPAAIRHVTYAKAKQLDVSRTHPKISWWSPKLTHMATTHHPKICRRCGNFKT